MREPGCKFILGYIANERWLAQQAVDRNLCTLEDLEQDRKASIPAVIKDTVRRSGIRGLCIEIIWISRYATSLCWVLPRSYLRKRRSERDSQNLETFRELLRSPDSDGRVGAYLLEEDPQYWASCRYKIPQALYDSNFFEERTALYRWDGFPPTKV